jgi:3,4-dihydroxy 2-butanone 4-phosphate synthase/GTP cyclohydrolase II
MALVKGHIDPARPTLVRMHALSLFDDVFARDTDRQGLLEGAMQLIGEAGSGVVVLINRPAPDHASSAIRGLDRADSGADDSESAPSEQRDYGVGAQILAELGVRDMILLTNTRHSLVGLEGYDLSIVGERPIELNGE